MWEEHPEYQKAQAKLIGIGLAVLLVAGIAYCISEHDWDSLRQVLLFAGAIVFSLALLSGTAWLVVRIFTRRHRSSSSLHDNHDA
jgi:hypothetical protein